MSKLDFKDAVKAAFKNPNKKVEYYYGKPLVFYPSKKSNEYGWVKFDTKKNKVVFFNTITENEWSVTKARLYGTKTFLKRYGL